MAYPQWINARFLRIIFLRNIFLRIFFLHVMVVSSVFALLGCASHIDKVIPKELPTMKQIYDEKTGSGSTDVLRQREADIRARPINSSEDYLSELPPRAAQIDHLFPALPNPELYMYVKPHAIGNSGIAVPAYMTRFTLYDRTHYALPNEVISTVKHPGLIDHDTSKKKAVNNAVDPAPSTHPSTMSDDHED